MSTGAVREHIEGAAHGPHVHDGSDPLHCPACASIRAEHMVVWRLVGTLLGGALILNAFIADAFFPDSRLLGELSGFVGALLLALPLFIASWKSLRAGRLGIEELASLGILACFALSDYKTAGVVAFFLLMASLIQHRTALGARAAVESLLRISPSQARLVEPDGERMVDATSLSPGDLIRVRPGEDVAADGDVVKGTTALSEATITGESLPADKGVGDRVFAGTTNVTGLIEVRVTRTGSDTTLGRVKELILEAESTRSPIMRLVDQYAGWYTPTMLMVVALILFFTHDASRAIAAIVVACPCAIILATPTAMVASLSSAARLGILVKNVTDLEVAGSLSAVVFDKTGTLTTGSLSVASLEPAPGVDAKELLRVAGAAERHSNHPIARAVTAVADEAKLEMPEPEDYEEVAGVGVRARVEGVEVLVGREAWLAERGVRVPMAGGEEALSTLAVSRGGKFIGRIGLQDKTRAEAARATEELRELGVRRVVMLTGDRRAVADRVGAELGCTDVRAECLPATKLETVDELKREGYRVAVIGDGVNDAPALAAGHVGIAMAAAASDIAINSASVALMNNDLQRIPFMIKLSRKTRRVVNENLAFGLLFIIGGLSLAGTGLLTPILAAVLHNVGSFFVIFNSARMVRMGEELQPFFEDASVGS